MPFVTIKKYSNRRLYDTDQSRYITQDELAERIREGVDVKVIDAKKGTDLTQVTLTQIIVESRGAAKLLPAGLLMQLIRLEDEALAEFFGRYLAGALEVYVAARKGARSLAPYYPFANVPFAATNAFARLFTGAMDAGGKVLRREDLPTAPIEHAEPQPPEAGAPEEREDAIAAMRRELDELKDLIRGTRK